MADAIEIVIALMAKDAASAALGSVGARLDALGKAGQIAKVGIAAVSAGLATAATAALDFGKAAAEEETTIKRLSMAVKNAGGDWAKLGAGIEKEVQSLQKFTTFVDEDIRDALTTLTFETGNVDEAMKRLPVAMDLASLTGMDLSSTARLLGRDLDRSTGMLTRYGIQVREGATDMEILQAIMEKTKGTSVAMAETAEGKMAQVRNSIDKLKETLGQALLPAFKTVADAANNALEALNAWAEQPEVQAAITNIGNAFGTAARLAGEFFGVLTGAAPDAGATLTSIIGVDSAKNVMGFVAGLRTVGQVLGEMVGVLTGLKPDAGEVLTSLLGEGEAKNIMSDLAGIRENIKGAFGWLGENGPGIWANLKTAIGAAWDFIKPKLDAMVDALGKVKDAFDKLPKPMQDAIGSAVAIGVVSNVTGIDNAFVKLATGLQGAGGLIQVIDKLKANWALFVSKFVIPMVVIGTIALVIAALWEIKLTVDVLRENWDKLTKAHEDGTLKQQGALGAFLDFVMSVGDKIGEIWSTTTSNMRLVWDKAVEVATTTWRNFSNTFTAIVNGLRPIWEPVVNALRTAWETLTAALGTVWEAFTSAWGTAVDALKTAWDAFTGALGTAWNALCAGIELAWLNVKLLVLKAWDAMKRAAATAINAIIDVVNPLWTLLGNPPIAHIEVTDDGSIKAVEDEIKRVANRTYYSNIYVDWTLAPSPLDENGMPRRMYQEGTPYVEETGLAILHKGEAVIPAEENPFTVGSGWQRDTGVAQDALVRRLADTVAELGQRVLDVREAWKMLVEYVTTDLADAFEGMRDGFDEVEEAFVDGVQNMRDRMRGLIEDIRSAADALRDLGNTPMRVSGGGAAPAGGGGSASQGATEADVQAAFQQYLGRTAGYEEWAGRIGADIAQMRAEIQASLEAQMWAARTAGLAMGGPGMGVLPWSGIGNAVNGLFGPIASGPGQGVLPIAGYQEGTAYVPHTGLAWLHKGEAVLTRSENMGGAERDVHEVHVYLDGRDITQSTRLEQRRSQRRIGTPLEPSAT